MLPLLKEKKFVVLNFKHFDRTAKDHTLAIQGLPITQAHQEDMYITNLKPMLSRLNLTSTTTLLLVVVEVPGLRISTHKTNTLILSRMLIAAEDTIVVVKVVPNVVAGSVVDLLLLVMTSLNKEKELPNKLLPLLNKPHNPKKLSLNSNSDQTHPKTTSAKPYSH